MGCADALALPGLIPTLRVVLLATLRRFSQSIGRLSWSGSSVNSSPHATSSHIDMLLLEILCISEPSSWVESSAESERDSLQLVLVKPLKCQSLTLRR